MVWSRISVTCAMVLVFAVHGSMAQQPAPSQSDDASQEVLAIVNGVNITKMHFDMLLEQYRPESRQWAEANKGQVLQQLVLRHNYHQSLFHLENRLQRRTELTSAIIEKSRASQ